MSGVPMKELPALVREVFVSMGWLHPKEAEDLRAALARAEEHARGLESALAIMGEENAALEERAAAAERHADVAVRQRMEAIDAQHRAEERATEAEQERDELAASVEKTIEHLHRLATEEGKPVDVCGWCGAFAPLTVADLRAHVAECPKNPAVHRAAAAEAREAGLREALRDLNDALHWNVDRKRGMVGAWFRGGTDYVALHDRVARAIAPGETPAKFHSGKETDHE